MAIRTEVKERKALDRKIEISYYRQHGEITILVSDIPKLFADVRRDVAAGCDLDQSVKDAIQRYKFKA